jgi:hypothetical protein
MSHGGKLTTLACHLTKKVNQAEELTYLSTNIGYLLMGCPAEPVQLMPIKNTQGKAPERVYHRNGAILKLKLA